MQGTFNGGYDENEHIAFSMQQTEREDSHSFTITCFGTNNGMVLLGAGLHNKNGKPLHTTVEQCIIQDEPTINSQKTTVRHGQVHYTNLEPNSTFHMLVESRDGDWSRNNQSQKGSVTENMLQITITDSDHTSYAYCIQPHSQINKTFTLVNNTTNNQAILLPDNKIAAAFYTQSSFTYDGKTYEGDANSFHVFDLK